ncbi:MAG: adenine-specific methyltransferase EcoRI family protein [Nitrospira sp.]|nr:adenine-specific methyltransferase EcoRI family protein [Nitrospira sp.]MDE0505166.1 adenine-specific methyltransferase EcoRI family protein [Candidatus Poribacteria bacterium]
MTKNKNLQLAKAAKKDEFYTQLSDIENELRHYTGHFRGKVVYCNCDDPRVSNFFHYFSHNFEHLGLKKLITTCYRSQNPDLFSSHDTERAIMLEYDGFREGDVVPKVEDIGIKELEGDGDFRNEECIEILNQADIVVTNPPFSLFRVYLNHLVEHGKSFIILGNVNALKYRDVFPLFMANRLWLGPSISSGDREFGIPDDYPLEAASYRVDGDGNKFIRVKGVRWFTNLDHKKRHEELLLYEKYTPEEYPTYENFDAINVDQTKYIPVDYAGVMGVPITFMDKYNPDQFEILGIGIAGLGLAAGVQPYKTEHRHYRKNVQQCGAVDGDLYMMVDGKVKVPYSRILIRNRTPKEQS